MLLLHGLASTRRFWDLVVPRLAGLPVVALDARGHGESDQPADGYDAGTVVRDVLTALDALGHRRVVVVGHSWGAWLALRLAAEAPERVGAVVAVDGGLSSPLADLPREERRRRLQPPRGAVPPDELRSLLRRGPLGPWWSPEVERAVLPLFGVGEDGAARARLPLAQHMQVVDDLLDTDSAAVLARVGCPTWLVGCVPAGDDERAVTVEQGLAAARAARPDARVLRWDGALHDVPLQWPDLVAGLIRAAVADATDHHLTGPSARPSTWGAA